MGKRKGKRSRTPAAGTPLFSTDAFSSLATFSGAPQSVLVSPAPTAPSVREAVERKGSRFPHKLCIRREKKGRSGKTITRITGVAQGDLAPLCREMKKALGCGATVEDSGLVLSGDLVQRSAAWLKGAGANHIVLGN